MFRLFLEDITMTYIAPCIADPDKIRLFAEMSTDIGEVMPYLNAVMKNATYNKNGPNLTFMKEFRLVTLYPRKITMAKALNTTDAWQVLSWIKDMINDVHERRDSITPDHELRSRPTALQIYGWLPKTNCKDCGELTCLAFAVKLLLGQKSIEQCTPLFSPEHAERREAMLEIVAAIGYEVPEKLGSQD